MAPIKMANDAPSCPRPTAATATDTKATLAAATITMATLAPAQAKSIVMNLYLDCDAKSAGEIIKAANRETRAVCTLDNEVPCKKSLVIMKGPQHEVKKANEIMESQLKKLHTELSGYKPMHVLLEGVGSVEVCIIHVKTNPHSKTG